MRKICIAFIVLLLISTSCLADEEKNQVSILVGINSINESGSGSDYQPGVNDFSIISGHRDTLVALSYARFIPKNMGIELDCRYHKGTSITLTDPSDREQVDVDTLNNYSITGNFIYKFAYGIIHTYVTAGAGVNVLSPYEREFTSDRGCIIIVAAPEKTNNFNYNVGGGMILNYAVRLRLDVRYASISNIDKEIEEVIKVSGKGEEYSQISDLFLTDLENNEIYVEIKTIKPNKGEAEKAKRTMLKIVSLINKPVKVLVGMAYNPYEPQDYSWSFTLKYFNIGEDLLIGKPFWDFLGGDGAYEEQLRVFEKSGEELRDKIEGKFSELI